MRWYEIFAAVILGVVPTSHFEFGGGKSGGAGAGGTW